MKDLRKVWHPDNSRKFAGKDVEVAERMEKKMKEISVVVSELLEPLLGKDKWEGETKGKEDRAF